jgi:hypothetical protein
MHHDQNLLAAAEEAHGANIASVNVTSLHRMVALWRYELVCQKKAGKSAKLRITVLGKIEG